jgi:serine/threonine-protein kinase RsbW
MTLELRATPEEVMRAVDALQQFGRERGVSEQALFKVALALEECASNIVNHAYQRDPRRAFRVSLEYGGDAMTVELRDDGVEFNPTARPEAAPLAEGEERPPGGWGIELVRRSVDEITYRRECGENVLRLTKHVSRNKTV